MNNKSVALVLKDIQKAYGTIELKADEESINLVFEICEAFCKVGFLSPHDVDSLVRTAERIDEEEITNNQDQDALGIKHRNFYRGGF